MYDSVTDLDHATESDETLLLNLISPEQFGVIAEVAQEPGQFPEGFLGAVDATRNRASGQWLGLEDGEAEEVVRFVPVPAILSAVDPDQEQPIRYLHGRRRIGSRADLECGASSSTFLAAEIAVELAEQGIAVFLGPIGQMGDEVFDLLA